MPGLCCFLRTTHRAGRLCSSAAYKRCGVKPACRRRSQTCEQVGLTAAGWAAARGGGATRDAVTIRCCNPPRRCGPAVSRCPSQHHRLVPACLDGVSCTGSHAHNATRLAKGNGDGEHARRSTGGAPPGTWRAAHATSAADTLVRVATHVADIRPCTRHALHTSTAPARPSSTDRGQMAANRTSDAHAGHGAGAGHAS